MKKYIPLVILITVPALIVLAIAVLMTPKPAPVPDPPCEELVWMRDSPQARCVEYWKQRNIEEAKNESIYEQ